MSSLPRKLVAIITVVLGIAAVFSLIKLNRDKREARQLILDAERLEQSDDPMSLSDFLVKHKKLMRPVVGCNKEQCAYAAELRNAPLPFLHLAPPSELYISVIAKRSDIQEIYISAKTAIAGRPYAATVRSVSRCKEACKAFSSEAVADSSGKTLVSTVELGPGATPADRRTAFQIDASCMFEMKGCTDRLQITGGWPMRAVD